MWLGEIIESLMWSHVQIKWSQIFIESFNVGREQFIKSFNVVPKKAMSAVRGVYESGSLHIGYGNRVHELERCIFAFTGSMLVTQVMKVKLVILNWGENIILKF